jgi:hypothetical protein
MTWVFCMDMRRMGLHCRDILSTDVLGVGMQNTCCSFSGRKIIFNAHLRKITFFPHIYCLIILWKIKVGA